MKRDHKFTIAMAVALLCIVILFLLWAASPALAYDGEPVWTARMEAAHQAADMLRWEGYSNDSEEIRALSAVWWEDKEALDIVAKVIQNEADPAWCEWEHSVAVGAVVCNRVRSPYFPNTVREVVNAPGQYLPAYTRNFDKTTRLAYEAAKAALDGDHDVPDNAFWQDNKRQGVYVWREFLLDTGWYRSTTYICCGIPGVE